MSASRGRPRKVRPKLGDPIAPGMTLADMAAATGIPLRRMRRATAIASLSDAEFEQYLARPQVASPSELEILSRRRDGKATDYTRRCPHCGLPLRIEDAR